MTPGVKRMGAARELLKGFSSKYVRFVEHHGFTIILTVCVGVIAGTALWTNQSESVPATPTSPAMDAALAAQLYQESLESAATPTPAPTEAPQVWQSPLATVSVLQGFDNARLHPSGTTGLWRLHDGVDLACPVGEVISAMAEGTVTSVSSGGLMGATVTIDHGHGVVIEYAGMSMLAGLQAGDPVAAGQTIGFGGNGVMDEADLEPHLHLRVTRDGQAIDPLSLLRE